MRRRVLVAGLAAIAAVTAQLGTAATAQGAAAATVGTRTTTTAATAGVVKGTTRVLGAARTGHASGGATGAVGRPTTSEFAPDLGERSPAGAAAAARAAAVVRPFRNRSFARRSAAASKALQRAQALAAPSGIVRTGAQLLRSFQGLDHYDTRTADAGNAFSTEPPDQALCVGRGYVVEGVNSVVQVDTPTGHRGAKTSLNTFFGAPYAINRTTGAAGPDIFDPTCVYDPSTGTFYFVADELGVDPASGDLTGAAYLDIAVTQKPTGAWRIYRLPVTDDGSEGTPVHSGCPCFGDYPHVGFDSRGFYISTNEFSVFGEDFNGSQIYAFDKHALATAGRTIYVTQFDTSSGPDAGLPGFTVWPAQSPSARDFNRGSGGTEYFLSSIAVFADNGAANQISIWTLTGTSTLNRRTPSAVLHVHRIGVKPYAVPPPAVQKSGPTPLRDCLNDVSCRSSFLAEPAGPAERLSDVDTNDSRMQQVVYTGGRLYSALDTAVSFGSETDAGIAWYVVKPVGRAVLTGTLVKQGQFGLPGNSVTYPAVGVTSAGRGVIAYTLVGRNFYPSAAYSSISTAGVGPIKIAALGKGPEDGFTGYEAYAQTTTSRWGDYGAASVVGANVWIASEYIGQSCTFAQYTATAGTCGNTRTALANWGTRISLVRP